jgi:hypothetical protein
MIGYRVELLQTSDPIGPQRLHIDFHLDNDEQIFETILNDKIRLNVIVSGKIESLNHAAWNKTLSPKTDLTQEIKTDVLREIRNRILKVTPDNFYAKFNSEVPEEIKNSIKALLITRYNLKPDVDVHLKIEHSQLKDRLSELSSGSLYTNVDLYNNAAGYTIKFCILDVPFDKWSLFANKKYVSIEEEKESIKEDLKVFVEKKLRQLVSEKAVGSKFLVDVVQRFAEEAVPDIRSNRFLNINIEKVIETTNEVGGLITGGNLNFIKETILKLQARRSAILLEIVEAKKAEYPKRVKELEDELSGIEKTLNPGSSDEEISKLISFPAENRTGEKGNIYISGE